MNHLLVINWGKTVAKAIRHYKTKNGIHMRLQKE